MSDTRGEFGSRTYEALPINLSAWAYIIYGVSILHPFTDQYTCDPESVRYNIKQRVCSRGTSKVEANTIEWDDVFSLISRA